MLDSKPDAIADY